MLPGWQVSKGKKAQGSSMPSLQPDLIREMAGNLKDPAQSDPGAALKLAEVAATTELVRMFNFHSDIWERLEVPYFPFLLPLVLRFWGITIPSHKVCVYGSENQCRI